MRFIRLLGGSEVWVRGIFWDVLAGRAHHLFRTGLCAQWEFFAASVLTGRIGEFSPEEIVSWMVLEHESWLLRHATGTPQGLAVDGDGDLYYAVRDIVWEKWIPGPGSNGRVWRIRFDGAGAPGNSEVLLEGLAFPGGLGGLRRSTAPR